MLRQTTSLALNHKKSSRFTPAAGSLYTFNYARGEYWNSTTRSTLAGTHTSTRASVRETENVARNGLLPQLGNNITAIDGRGALIESAATNNIRNNSLAGFVAGSPGTLPTNVSITTPTGLTRTLSQETINGATWLRVSYTGTAGSTSAITIIADTGFTPTALNSYATSQCLFQAINDTGWPAGNAMLLENWAYDSGPSFLSTGSIQTSGTYTAAELAARTLKCLTVTRQFLDATVANSRVNLRTQSINSGTVCDIEFRIAIADYESTSYATSPILTSGAAATRAAETFIATAAFGTTDYTVAGVARAPAILTSSGTIAVIATDATNYIGVRLNSSANALLLVPVVAGVQQTTTVAAVPTAGARFGWAMRKVGNVLSLVLNGGAVNNNTPALTPASAPATIQTGQLNGANAWNGRVEQHVVFGSGVSDATLQSYATLGTLP